MFPLAIKPHHPDLSVIGQEFFDLSFHIVHVPIEVRSFSRACFPTAPREIIGMMPVHDRMVPADLYVLSVTFLREFFQDVASERSGIHYVIICHSGLEETESVMMLACYNYIFHASIFGRFHPLLCIELFWIKLVRKLFIIFDRDLSRSQYPFGMIGLFLPFPSRDRIQSPMNEQPEPGFPPPGHALFVLFLGFFLHWSPQLL